jgi:hypothetical protein
MANLTRDINGKSVQSAYACEPFDVAKATLEGKGYAIITPEKFAQLRMLKGARHNVSLNGAYTSRGTLMVPQKGRYITELSLVMEKPTEATQAHREGREFAVSVEDAKRALDGKNVVIPYKQASVPTNRFGEDPITVFVFGESAGKYGEFLAGEGIAEMPLFFNDEKYINSQKTPFANQLWLRRLVDDGRSGLLGSGRGLSYGNAVRGVKYVEPRSGEDCAKKTAGYQFSERKAKGCLKVLEGVRNGTLPASKLEEVIKAFKN